MPIVTSQPFAINAPVAAVWERSDEKGCSREHYSHQYADLHDTESRRCRCKRKRARLILLSIAFVFCVIVSLVGALGLWDATFNDSSWLKGALGLTVDGGENSWTALSDLMKRQSNGTTGSNTFVNHKYYLIIIFVGLFLVVLAAICLSAWCCRGAFQNPLCCPCYVCACCGGLACLECIGCGLCAEGIDQM